MAPSRPAKAPHEIMWIPSTSRWVYGTIRSAAALVFASDVGPSWVFEFGVNQNKHFFVMRCPAHDCSSPVFSKHPLFHKRAIEHLANCGRHFRNDKEMVYECGQRGQYPRRFQVAFVSLLTD